MNEYILEARGLRKVYEEGPVAVEAVRDVSLRVKPGESVAIMGPSGSGKTTLLSMIGCILRPTRGEVIIEGRPVRWEEDDLTRVRLRSIGFVFQSFNLFSALTALENVEVALNLREVRGSESKRRAREMMEAVGLGDRADFLPRDLSGGQKQRVSIARALVNRPPLILADEPTGNLDSKTGHAIIELLRDLVVKENRSVVVVTHDARMMDLVHRVYRLEDGVLIS
ncbi:MAG TPA: ABC transporter ATP-binding protein [Nitrospiria bacterium]|nr:ABC transporter ATP-binding protein [Nitrospiria bacterium]